MAAMGSPDGESRAGESEQLGAVEKCYCATTNTGICFTPPVGEQLTSFVGPTWGHVNWIRKF